jgi:hypothetical protein
VKTERIFVEKILERGYAMNFRNAMAFGDTMGSLLPLFLKTTRFESGGKVYYTPRGTEKPIGEGDTLKIRKPRFGFFGLNCDIVDNQGNCYQMV